MVKLTKLIVCISFCLFLFGCAGTRMIEEPPVSLLDVYMHLDEKPAKPSTLRVMAKVDYFDEIKGDRVAGRDFVISAQAPSSLRVTLSSFDKALSTMVTDGESFYLMDATQNVFIMGRATAENISQLLPLYLSASDIYQVLMGGYPTEDLSEDWDSTKTFKWDGSVGAYCLTLPRKDGSQQQVFFSYPELDIVEMRFVRDGEIHYQYIAKDFVEQDGIRFPDKIAFVMPEQKTDVRLRITQRDINLEFKPQVFILQPLEGMPVRYMIPELPTNNND